MQWERLTGDEFETAVSRAEGVCVIPVGVIEYHGPHLPLGQDMFVAHAVACRAAEQEPAIVYLPYYFGVNVEYKHRPGGIIINGHTIFELLENICDEISRNGLKKILLLSGHGGNKFFLQLFVQLSLDKGKDYTLYYVKNLTDLSELCRLLLETKAPDHAGEWETSLALHIHPELVKTDTLGKEPCPAADGILDHIQGEVLTAVDWFGMYPGHREGASQLATVEKGGAIFDTMVARLVNILRAIKVDRAVPDLYASFQREIYQR